MTTVKVAGSNPASGTHNLMAPGLVARGHFGLTALSILSVDCFIPFVSGPC